MAAAQSLLPLPATMDVPSGARLLAFNAPLDTSSTPNRSAQRSAITAEIGIPVVVFAPAATTVTVWSMEAVLLMLFPLLDRTLPQTHSALHGRAPNALPVPPGPSPMPMAFARPSAITATLGTSLTDTA
jgi:hypothetical protein